ncbi:MAG: hypothetical protein IPO21_02665 [Bacteroidales bacterium]|nr:hypothetical protein [Bacteroidales bacterium]
MRQTRKDEKFSGKITGQDYSDILFEELLISKTKITKTRFNNIHFKNSQLGYDSEYNDCEFLKCKFFGKYSTLGFSTKYSNCKFIDCEFIGVTLFEGSKFYNCTFSGVIRNAIIRDSKFGLFSKKTSVFNDCDLSSLIFDNLSLYGNGLNNCILPKKGIRKFQNDKDSLIDKASEICSKIYDQEKIESEIIFKRDLKSGQNPIILDDLFLETFFKSTESRHIFDIIVEGFEIK